MPGARTACPSSRRGRCSNSGSGWRWPGMKDGRLSTRGHSLMQLADVSQPGSGAEDGHRSEAALACFTGGRARLLARDHSQAERAETHPVLFFADAVKHIQRHANARSCTGGRPGLPQQSVSAGIPTATACLTWERCTAVAQWYEAVAGWPTRPVTCCYSCRRTSQASPIILLSDDCLGIQDSSLLIRVVSAVITGGSALGGL